MLNAIKKMLGLGPSVDFSELKSQGAKIIDVRTKGEYNRGHIKGSKNVPLDNIKNNPNSIKVKDKSTPIITCCASGMRSSSAKSILKSSGYQNVHNGGGWKSLERKLRG